MTLKIDACNYFILLISNNTSQITNIFTYLLILALALSSSGYVIIKQSTKLVSVVTTIRRLEHYKFYNVTGWIKVGDQDAHHGSTWRIIFITPVFMYQKFGGTQTPDLWGDVGGAYFPIYMPI